MHAVIWQVFQKGNNLCSKIAFIKNCIYHLHINFLVKSHCAVFVFHSFNRFCFLQGKIVFFIALQIFFSKTVKSCSGYANSKCHQLPALASLSFMYCIDMFFQMLLQCKVSVTNGAFMGFLSIMNCIDMYFQVTLCCTAVITN